MNLNKLFFCILISLLFITFQQNIYGKDKSGISIDEKLGSNIPLNVKFVNSSGQQVILKNFFTDMPVVFAFVYYKCPGICTPLMTEIAEVINKSNLEPGIDYRVVVLSMDEKETPKIAAEKKKAIFNLLDKKIAPEDWEFLTGSF